MESSLVSGWSGLSSLSIHTVSSLLQELSRMIMKLAKTSVSMRGSKISPVQIILTAIDSTHQELELLSQEYSELTMVLHCFIVVRSIHKQHDCVIGIIIARTMFLTSYF